MDWNVFLLFVLTWCYVLFSMPRGSNSIILRDLVVKYQDSDVTDEVYINGTNECMEFWHSFSKQDLPPGEWTNSVDKPQGLDVSLFNSPYSDDQNLYPGAIISWKSPLSRSSRDSLKGFFAIIDGNKTDDRCHLYIINNTGFADKELEFSFSMPLFAIKADSFAIRIYSLPPPDRKKKDNHYMYEFAVVKTSGREYVGFPGNWKSNIVYKPSLTEATIDVTFLLPPKMSSWHLTHFDVMLMRRSCSLSMNENSYKSLRVITESNTTDTQRHVQFHGLENDIFSVLVGAVNYEFPKTDLCICRTQKDHCSSSCESIRTQWFDLAGKMYGPSDWVTPKPELCRSTTTMTTTPRVSETSQRPTLESSPSTNTSSTNMSFEVISTPSLNTETHGATDIIIIGATVAAVVTFLILIVVVIILCFWRRRRRGESTVTFTDIKRQAIYLLATADDKESACLVDSYTDFLKNHCECDVIHPRNFDLSQTCESVWISAHIQKCDCIVVLYSKEAEEIIDKFVNGSTLVWENFVHSSFQGALQILFNSSPHKPVVCVSFTQNRIKHLLAQFHPKNFQIPKEVTQMVFAIHDLGCTSFNNKHTKFILNMNKLRHDPDWHRLLSAIEKMKTFQSRNSDLLHVSPQTLSVSGTSSETSGYISCGRSHQGDYSIDLKSLSEASFASLEKNDACIHSHAESCQDEHFDELSPSVTKVEFNNSTSNMDYQSFVTIAKYSDVNSSQRIDSLSLASFPVKSDIVTVEKHSDNPNLIIDSHSLMSSNVSSEN